MSHTITVIGSANADLVIHTDRMPALGETLRGHRFQVNAGGKGLNQAVAVARLGGDTTFVGAVGNDAHGAMLRRTLRENGIRYTPACAGDAETGIAVITVVNGDNFIVLNAGANDCLTAQAVESVAAVIAESAFCVLQLEIPPDAVLTACAIARAHGTRVVLNPAPYRDLPDDLLAAVDYLIPNEHEAQQLTGIVPDTDAHCREAIAYLRQKGVRHVIITRGEHGCVYNRGDEVVFCPAAPSDVIDTTSAGDCFIGALVTKLSQNATLDDAVAFATKAAAIAVSREGAAASIPFASEIED